MPSLDLAGFADVLGVRPDALSPEVRSLISKADFSYDVIQGEDRDRLILDILRRIHSDQQVIGAESRTDVWDKGWKRNLDDFLSTGYSTDALIPKFIRPGQPVRLKQAFVLPKAPDFELRFIEVLRNWMFREYFETVDNVYEFGCGTGFNLVALAKQYPGKRLFGSDFVPSSVELVNAIARHGKLNLSGEIFDMISPRPDYVIRPSSAVFTFGSIEQLASRFDKFLDYLLVQKPSLCLHVEPTVELYDENNLVDFLAIQFHRKRGYTEGLLPRLQRLNEQGRIKLESCKRLGFGSLMMEGYNLMVWRPL